MTLKVFFKESCNNRTILEGIHFKSLSNQDRSWLEKPFSKEEIKEAVWNCDGNKSADPDGFSFEFIKKCWDTIKEDISCFVKDFH